MFIPLLDDLTAGIILATNRVFVQRLIFTSIAIVIGLLCELIIYKNAASNSGKMKENVRK